ncbi:hypothetical protein THAOC_00954 [Thalassiosira oceanica]|uniref:Uncharacterized protein n=1 Tax=Thalassiosira oceanica TaxID=159749 RepID=K0TEV5_THAOC|nr:hypothetical protein THAOC_00954 [Thalassiosira oceanica]|eukprot:EJK77228.1 hypothetical protein THAOC_00954 [Thalassiosira oceanica]
MGTTATGSYRPFHGCHAEPPAAVGKPSFPYFNADYQPDDVCRPRRPTIFGHQNLTDSTTYTKDTKTSARTAGIRGIGPYPSSMKPNPAMDSINPAKKRKAASGASDPPRPGGNDDPGNTLPANFSLADLNRLIDRRVAEVVEAKTLELTSRVDGLQRENERLLLRCESLERSVQVLKREGNWDYSVPDVPRSHWLEQGYDEEDAEEAEKLIQSIKEGTCDLRSAVDVEAHFGCETFILSDRVLNPHLEQLANAIQLSERISKLNFFNVQLDEHTLQMIERSVRQKGLAGLYLGSNQFREGEGVKFAVDVLNSNRLVDAFSWSGNTFRSTEDACKLIDTVLEHPKIKDLVCGLH